MKLSGCIVFVCMLNAALSAPYLKTEIEDKVHLCCDGLQVSCLLVFCVCACVLLIEIFHHIGLLLSAHTASVFFVVLFFWFGIMNSN